MTQHRSAAQGTTRYTNDLRDMLTRVLQQQDELLKNQQRLEIAMTTLQASVPTRAEIQTLLDQRVAQSVYIVESQTMKADIQELKERFEAQPHTVWNRASIAIMAFVAVGSLILSIITLFK